MQKHSLLFYYKRNSTKEWSPFNLIVYLEYFLGRKIKYTGFGGYWNYNNVVPCIGAYRRRPVRCGKRLHEEVFISAGDRLGNAKEKAWRHSSRNGKGHKSFKFANWAKRSTWSKKYKRSKVLRKIYTSGEELDIFEVTNYKNFIGKVANNVRVQNGVIENTRNILKVKQLEVNAALKEVKVLEKLKEKQEAKFYEHLNYLEMKELDDIASTRYKRVLV